MPVTSELPGEHWLEPAELLSIARRDVTVQGDERLEDAIMREPRRLIGLGPPSMTPLDLHTYRARRDRWESGEGPKVNGMPEFMAALEGLTAPARVVTVKGRRTTYVFLLDAHAARVLGCVAIDPP